MNDLQQIHIGIILLIGIGFFTFCLLWIIQLKIKTVFIKVAKKIGGTIQRKNILSSYEISFIYKGNPALISFALGGKYSSSHISIKITTHCPKNINIEIRRKDSLYKSLNKLGLESPDVKTGNEIFDKLFKPVIRGKENEFLNNLLSPSILNALILLSKRWPIILLYNGKLIFRVNDLPFDIVRLETYYHFIFQVADHLAYLLDKES